MCSVKMVYSICPAIFLPSTLVNHATKTEEHILDYLAIQNCIIKVYIMFLRL